MRVTLDTNVFISATQWESSVAHKLLIKMIEKDFEVFTTQEILEEFAKVLKRDFKYEDEEVSNIIIKIMFFTNIIEPSVDLDVVLEDPDDNKIIECAIESESDYIVSYDKHLLKIKEYKSIKILTPEEMFEVINARIS